MRPATERGLPIVKASISSAYQLSYHPVAPVDTRIYGNTQVKVDFSNQKQVVVLSYHIVRFVLKPCLRHPNNPIGLERHDEACGKNIGKRIWMVSLLILHSLLYYIYIFFSPFILDAAWLIPHLSRCNSTMHNLVECLQLGQRKAMWLVRFVWFAPKPPHLSSSADVLPLLLLPCHCATDSDLYIERWLCCCFVCRVGNGARFRSARIAPRNQAW